jgi:hypothetical protein
MKDTTDKPTTMDQIAEAWAETDLGVKIAFSWLALVFLGLVVVGILFPIAGLIMLGILALVGTCVAVGYLIDY